jgi:hypothetical protein
MIFDLTDTSPSGVVSSHSNAKSPFVDSALIFLIVIGGNELDTNETMPLHSRMETHRFKYQPTTKVDAG